MNIAARSLFVAAAITDWVDGWLARKLGQTSAFGAFLDPVADKLLVCAALVMLVELNRVGALVAVIIIGREITISALREWMAQIGAHGSVPCTRSASSRRSPSWWRSPCCCTTSRCSVSSTCTDRHVADLRRGHLTVWSMFYYLRRAWPYLRDAM
jgi:cardiolipin synthase